MDRLSGAQLASSQFDGVITSLSARLLRWSTAALLVLCWLLGGVTEDSTSMDEILQLLALPVLVMAVVVIMERRLTGVLGLALMLAATLVALPVSQLIRLPEWLGMAGAMRHGIATDLASAGVQHAASHASLSTFATEHALWSLLPALATYLGALAIPVRQLRIFLQLIIMLALFSGLFAFFQLSLPDGSPLLLFTQLGRNFGGLFANTNHQGSALTIGAVIAAALFIEGRRRARLQDGTGGPLHWLYGFLCVVCVAMVPLANGSAAMLLVMVGLVVVWVILGVDLPSVRRRRTGQLGLAVSVVLAAVVLVSALALQHVEEERRLFASTTVEIGKQFAPLGVGVGNFVPTYAQYSPPAQARMAVVNHAHNEYAQWWLEAGTPALLLVLFGLAVFAWLGWQVLRRTLSFRLRTFAAAAWTSLLILLMHSLVDYPLRTTALMATAGLLAGLLFNAVSASRRSGGNTQDTDADSQQA